MRVISLHPDVLVATSRVWQTTCTIVRSGDEAFVVDSPVLPDELELLPTVAQQSGFAVEGLLATHHDWDHVLGRPLITAWRRPRPLEMPEAFLRVCVLASRRQRTPKRATTCRTKH